MESTYYFVPGYTGFCPELIQCIGSNYGDATRKILREMPDLKKRLSPIHYQGNRGRKSGRRCPMGYDEKIVVDTSETHGDSGSGCGCKYPPMPTFIEGYTGHVPKRVCVCARHGRESEKSCPSKCRPSNCGDVCAIVVEDGYYQDVPDYDEPCRVSDRGYYCQPKGVVHYPVQDTRRQEKRSRKPCCGSCAKGGSCEGDRMSNKCKSSQSPHRVRFPRVMPHRQGGVIVNYTGHIPGMMFSHGETYGISSRRLLDEHFDNMAKMRMREINDYR